jgi:hypothetical protein
MGFSPLIGQYLDLEHVMGAFRWENLPYKQLSFSCFLSAMVQTLEGPSVTEASLLSGLTERLPGRISPPPSIEDQGSHLDITS